MERATDSGKDGDHQRQVSDDDDEETEIEETAYDFHDFNIHQAVIKDNVRNEAYRAAILQHQDNYIKDRVVVDVGSGTGILSIFCAQAGAKRVYAVEDTEIALQAQKVMEANNLSERVIVLHGYVEDVGINEKVDVIVSDWMDQLLLYNHENMLGSVLTARDRLLKPGGLIMPSNATLYIAPVTLPDRYSSKIDFWRNVYGIDMSAMVPWAIQDAYEDPCVEKIKSENLLALPQVVKRVDCYTINIQELESFKSRFEFQCLTRATFHGFAFWFDVEFSGPVTSPADSNAPPLQSSSNHPTTSGQKRKRDDPIEAIVLSTAPDKPPTHWEQDVGINEKVDVIVSDWMDQLLLYNHENMLGSVLTARDRLLKPGGLIMPSNATLYIAPVTLPDRYSSKIDFWRNVYGIDMSAMVPWAIQDAYEDPCVEKIKSENLLALPQVVKRVDCYTINIQELESFKSRFEFQCLTRATFHGFAFWFDVEFSGPVTSPADSNAPPLQSSSNHPTTSGQKRKRDDPIEAIVLSTAPDKPPTHWEQMVVYLNNPIDVEQGHRIEGSVTLTPNQEEDGPKVHIRLEYKSGHRSFVREAVMR